MPVKTYKDTTIATFILICFMSFVYSIMCVVNYNKDPDKHSNLKEHYSISIPICVVSGLIVVYEHKSRKRFTSVPV